MSDGRESPHVIVIGAGIVGAATAYYLTRAGARVTVIEAQTPSAGATGASDGAVSVASKRPGPMMKLAREARDLYLRLVDDGIMAGVFSRRSTFLFARSQHEMDLLESQRICLIGAGEQAEPLTRTQLLRKVPGLSEQVLGGLEVPHDGHAIGYQVVSRFLSGGDIVPSRFTPVRRLSVVGDRVVGVELVDGVLLSADRVVLAAGLGSGALIGLDGILIPRKGQLIITDRAVASGPALLGPLMSAGYLAAKRTTSPGQRAINLVIDPLQTGQFLIGSSREEGLTDQQTDASTVAQILRDALEVYPALARQRVIRTFAGVRATTQDGLPIVGMHPGVKGLVVATAMQGDGICLGPLVGAAAARLACDQEPVTDLAALSPKRFAPMSIAS